MSGAERIAAERKRQIEQEGWTEEHDDRHTRGELAKAAQSYMFAVDSEAKPLVTWPWADRWWKPKSQIRNLEIAGALLLAEADRLERMRAVIEGKIDEVLRERKNER